MYSGKFCFRYLITLLFLLAIVGCTSSRPLEDSKLRSLTPVHAVTLFDEKNQPVKIVGDRKMDRDNLDILAISGGGSNGAYGAGVISGWTKSGTRPNFDIVTGVSTGALIAVLAFAGPEYDEELRKLYTEQTNQAIYREKGFIAGIFSDSYYDYTPFKNQIQQVFDTKLLNKIAAEHRKGRRLYIASTNIDAGKLVVWDLGKLAASKRHNKLLRSQKIIRASAAVPGFFKPVYIKPRNGIEIRQAHVDGSVKAPVLIRNFMFDRPAKKKNLYVLLNSQMKLADATKAVEPDIASISTKTINEMLRGLLYKTVYQGYVTARNARSSFHMTYIPDTAKPIEFGLDFDREKMRALFRLGVHDGLSMNRWLTEPPRLESHERVALHR